MNLLADYSTFEIAVFVLALFGSVTVAVIVQDTLDQCLRVARVVARSVWAQPAAQDVWAFASVWADELVDDTREVFLQNKKRAANGMQARRRARNHPSEGSR